jgi:hypothetical protein
MTLYCCAVDTTIKFTRESYYFCYKKSKCKYQPDVKGNKTDSLIVLSSGDKNCAFRLISELISNFSFSFRRPFIVTMGLSKPHGDPNPNLEPYKGGYLRQRQFYASYEIEDFIYVCPLKTEQQIKLAHLYREAKSSNNLYAAILFYWHALVFPSRKDLDAECYINKIIDNLPND